MHCVLVQSTSSRTTPGPAGSGASGSGVQLVPSQSTERPSPNWVVPSVSATQDVAARHDTLLMYCAFGTLATVSVLPSQCAAKTVRAADGEAVGRRDTIDGLEGWTLLAVRGTADVAICPG